MSEIDPLAVQAMYRRIIYRRDYLNTETGGEGHNR